MAKIITKEPPHTPAKTGDFVAVLEGGAWRIAIATEVDYTGYVMRARYVGADADTDVYTLAKAVNRRAFDRRRALAALAEENIFDRLEDVADFLRPFLLDSAPGAQTEHGDG